MTDNLKTWPEEIYLGDGFGYNGDGIYPYSEFNTDIGWTDRISTEPSVRYIRADLVKDKDE